MPSRTKRRRRASKSTKAVAYKALKLARSIKQSQETKFIDYTFSHNNVSWTGTLSGALNDPAQGTTDSERIGDSIRCTSVQIRARLSRAGATIAGVRIIVIWDKHNTIANVNDILQITGNVYAPLSPLYNDGRSNFVLLMDRYLNVSEYLKNYSFFSKRLRLNKTTDFAAGGLVIEKGSLHVMTISDVDPAVGNKPDINYVTRVYYQDS